MINKPLYLGDAVYVNFDGCSVTLTTDSHEPADAKNIIYLEPRIIEALDDYLTRLREFIAAHPR